MREEIAQRILEETKKNYEKIAEQFSQTRQWPWGVMKLFLAYLNDGDKILDIGCGNGRLYDLLKEKSIEYVGIDNSERLVEMAKKKFPMTRSEFLVMDALNLEFRDEEFDAVFMIAVLPHLPSQKLQIKVLSEAYRVLKIDGYLFLTCWNLWQPKLFFHNFIQRLKKPKLYQDLGWKDFFVPWHLSSNEIIQRFYHAFTKKELKKILEKVHFKVQDIFYEERGQKSNWLKSFNLVALAKK
ncbi:MAG: methyltransferase domain-containing protein [Patescibacteria group bacterium]|nr:methyltransferase domain-containing protein [Patescibacteria group bacterium]